jgi:hypothetical protein
MRISKFMAVAASGCVLAAAATLPATAGTAHHAVGAVKTKQFPSTLSTHSPKPGQVMVLKGHGAKKRAQYSCVLIVIKGKNYTIGPLKNVNSTKKGRVTCKVKYKPYKAVSLTGGKSHHCPLTKKDKRAHFRCAVAVSTADMTSATIQYFTPNN